MKQLLSLFLFLLPCLAWAQYPSNGNQKITLGEQTTADGLIYRGVAADTTLTTKSDTAAYFVLDTVNINLYTYKASATGRKWRQLGADTAAIAYVNTYGTQTVNGAKTFTSTITGARFDPTSSSVSGNGMYLAATNTLGFSTSGAIKLLINSHGDLSTNVSSLMSTPWKSFEIGTGVGTMVLAGRTDGVNNLILGTNWYYDGGAAQEFIGSAYSSQYFQDNGNHIIRSSSASGSAGADITFNEIARFTKEGETWLGYTADNGAYKLQVNSQIFATNATIATSDIRFKENIQPLDKGLEIINKLKPVKFNFITTTENNFSEFDEIGFIAQDVEGALSTELFAKAVVKKLDEDKDDSALGLMTEKLIPILVKAIQEQQALIKALEQRIINLENK
jgi:hypothetical protein